MFPAFIFKYMLDSNINFNGVIHKHPGGILGNFGFDDLSKWQGLKSLSTKIMLPRHLKIMSRVIAKNRELLTKLNQDILKVDVTIETFKHRGNLIFKLIVLDQVKKVNKKVSAFFKKAALNFKAEMADVFLVNPRDINQLCNYLL